RFSRDWSSDVCSSDLEVVSDPLLVETGAPNALRFDTANRLRLFRVGSKVQLVWENDGGTQLTVTNTLKNEVVYTTNDWNEIRREIGRASCRERVCAAW